MGALAVVIVLALGVDALLDKRRSVREFQSLQMAVQQARDSVNVCQSDLGVEESSFRVFDHRVDSLRQAVRAMEGIDGRGVPGEQYGDYLILFDEYNESVVSWEARSASLRATETRCRDLVVAHNQRVDSLRARAESEGLGRL